MKGVLKKRLIVSIIMVILLATAFTGATFALLSSFAGPLENTFTIGRVDIRLTETTGGEYALIPGTQVDKDPCVTVIGGSEDCWLYFTLEKSANFDEYLTYEIEDGWIPLEGVEGVFYRSSTRSNGDTGYYILGDNCISVSATLTEEKMSEITPAPSIKFKAYAIQQQSVMSAREGWEKLNEGSER